MNTSPRLLSGLILGSLSLVSLVGCDSDDSLGPGAECDPHYYLCQEGFVCAELVTGGNRCFGELALRGEITNTSDGSAVEGAQVMVLNEEGIAVTDVARTDGMGNYDLKNVPAKRNADGSPAGTYTLRAAAQDYQAFPSGVRVAVPIDLGDATSVEGKYRLDSTLTHVGLIPLGVAERSSMSGTVTESGAAFPGEAGGVLVVASGANGTFGGLSDKSGNFTVFNLPPGTYEFRPYSVDLQSESASITVGRDPLNGLRLGQQNGPGLTTVTGSVELVNASGGAPTSVMLVVADTFDPLAARGEAPRGLRSPRTGSPDVSGNFSISGVPTGRYVVLPAYENDDLVRDPDTDFVTIDVMGTSAAPKPPPGPNADLKVTAALPTISPGAEAPEPVTTKPKLVWGNDSSADYYDVRAFDAFGDEVWNSLMLPGVSGSATASVQYEGPLEPGMYYHFRVTSWRAPDGEDPAPIATTEDLRGVFYLPAP